MTTVTRTLKIETVCNEAFRKFVHELNAWWPKEYTWSQQQLKEIRIDAKKDCLCTEIGPFGFRCDWGRVTAFTENENIKMKWQIGARREPVPDPDKASNIDVDFSTEGYSAIVTFRHYNFESHGEGWDEYQKMMHAEQGWDYILRCYKRYCEEK